MAQIALLDVLAPLWLLLCWTAYGWYADHQRGRASLMASMHAYRCLWMAAMLRRDNRMVDVQIIGNLVRSTTFFASTTMFIIGGLLAVLGARGQAMTLLRELPFAAETAPLLWDLKVLLLIVLFVYAFFKFTWAVRHYTYCLVLVGSAPPPAEAAADRLRVADKSARIATSTARHFNHGMRACYFGLAALSWFVHPALLIALSVWVVLVLYRREFRSRLLRTLGMPEVEASDAAALSRTAPAG